MKKTILIFCTILFAFAVQTEAQTQTKNFKGNIGDAKFQMNLTRDGKVISGNYFYEKSGSANKLNLKGELQPDGSFTLIETDASGKKTGTFKGVWKDDETTSGVQIDGTWQSPTGKDLNFYAFEQNINFTGNLSIATRSIKENNKPKLFDVNVEYPEIVGASSANVAKFNLRAKQLVSKTVSEFRKEMLAQTAQDLRFIRDLGARNSADIGYDVAYANNDLISLQFSDSIYTGGAHPSNFSGTLNYDLKNGRELALADLFKPKSDYLKVVSEYCIAQLKKQTGEMSDNDWVEKGASADAENYADWNVNEKGLIITFDPYQVAAYAAGPQTVIIPYEKLKGILAENNSLPFLKNNQSARTDEREKFDPKRDAKADMATAIAQARKSGKRIILDAGGEWCVWCVAMDKFFIANPELAKLRDENFVWVKVNFSEENENADFFAAYPKVAGYPHLFVLDENGKLLQSQNTSELEAGKSYNLEVYMNFLKKWSPKTISSPSK